MVKFRQKEYSGKAMRAVRVVKGVEDRVKSAIIPKRKPKSNFRLNRETVKAVRGAQETTKKVLETPIGVGVDKGISTLLENPLSTTGNVVGKALMVAPAPTFVKVLPIGGGSIAAEQALKKNFPKYRDLSNKAGEYYKKLRISKSLREGKLRGPSILDISKLIPIV